MYMLIADMDNFFCRLLFDALPETSLATNQLFIDYKLVR